ncbi:hypothetical protein FACS1894139_07690 [Planctomycetales bacterium]|nr:hypothetical protein FACS1894108_08970 [Planctomycetales bacterium]GHT04856.1 hypothetical protein FACS1894139_07690 [Planctomycetales bacterium]GHV23436.1 hypothetical protein AGMMS49959_16460 [Planctomycetales bacterium]
MPRVVKIIFLPVMLLAGIFTVVLMAALNTPVALWHLYREHRGRKSDLARARAWRQKFLAQCAAETAS